MRNRPAKICVLEKGKLIDVQKGFVDTFNWMVDVLDTLSKSNLVLVSASEYSSSKHKFKNKTIKVSDIISGKTNLTDSTVFTATPISED